MPDYCLICLHWLCIGLLCYLNEHHDAKYNSQVIESGYEKKSIQDFFNKIMLKIEWTDDYCVGEKIIDTQHRQLVSFYNDFCSHQQGSVSTAFIKASLHRMLAFLIEHTDYEESYIIENNFSFYIKDLDIHNKLIKDIE